MMARDMGKVLNLLAMVGVTGLAVLSLSMLQGRRQAGGVSGGGCCGGAWGAPLARGGQGSVTAEAEKTALVYAGTKFVGAGGILRDLTVLGHGGII